MHILFAWNVPQTYEQTNTFFFTPEDSVDMEQEGSSRHCLDIVVGQVEFSAVHEIQQKLQAVSRSVSKGDYTSPRFFQTTCKHGLDINRNVWLFLCNALK